MCEGWLAEGVAVAGSKGCSLVEYAVNSFLPQREKCAVADNTKSQLCGHVV